jgi:probable HAF family extracellular repeat protein
VGAKFNMMWAVLAAASIFTTRAAGAPTLFELPPTAGITGFQLSPDGSVAVGTFDNIPVIWSDVIGINVLPQVDPFSPFIATGAANAVSAHGTYVVGHQNVQFAVAPGVFTSVNQAVRWGPAGTVLNLGDLDTSGIAGNKFSRANGVSADGSVVVGETATPLGRQAFRWTSTGGMISLGGLPGSISSQARDVSADGAVVAGTAVMPGGPLNETGFRWSLALGMTPIPDLPGGLNLSTPNAISADGTTIVGYSSSTASSANNTLLKAEAYRWTDATGTLPLGDLPGGDYYSVALDVTADGSAVIGYSVTTGGPRAFIWDPAHGMRSLADVLVTDYGVTLGGSILTRADSISDDGTVIAGEIVSPASERYSYVIQLPEPGGPLLSTAAIALALRRRQRRPTPPHPSRTYV